MRIVASPDKLRFMAQQFGSASSTLQTISSRLSSAIGSLDWDARNKAGVDGQVNEARALAGNLAQQATSMSRYLMGKAQTFEEADHRGVENVGQLAGTFADLQRQWLQGQGPGSENLDNLLDTGSDALEGIDKLKEYAAIPAALMLGYAMKDGKTLISGSRGLKDMAGLSEYVTRIKPDNIPLHMAQQGLRHGLKMNPLDFALTVGPQWLDDFKEYRNQGGAKLGAALAVDGVLKMGIGIAAKSGGAWLGGALVVGLLGVGAAPVAIVAGGIAGGIVLGMVGEQVFNWLDEKGYRDAAINRTSQVFSGVGEATRSAFDATANFANRAARGVDDALDSAVKAVQGLPWPKF